MFSKLSQTAALFLFAGALAAGGCGSPASIVGTWSASATDATNASLKTKWTLKFADDNKFTESVVITNGATSGTGAGCVNSIEVSGKYSVAEKSLTLTADSGTSAYASCMNSSENVAPKQLSATDLATMSSDLSGPFTMTEEQLTLKMPAQGPKPGILSRQE